MFLFVCCACLSAGHVGSPDVYVDGSAGPYKLFVTIRPPLVIPGVAEINVRSETAGVREMRAVPLPLSGPGAEHAPVPDLLRRSAGDDQFYTGSVWLMTDGSWQVRIAVDGAQGKGTLSIPVPAIARTTLKMQWQLGAMLLVLGLFLVGGLAAIAGAAVREARLSVGAASGEDGIRKGRMATVIAFGVIAMVLWGGKTWWDSEVNVYQGRIYKPLNMRAEIDGGSVLQLNLSEPGWMQPQKATGRFPRVSFVRKMDDLVLDHDHLMHLYVIRQPGLDLIYHLHPEMIQSSEFRVALPAMPAGDYKLYADVVHENGLPETLTAPLHLAHSISESARPLSGDDARAQTQPVSDNSLADTFVLPDGYKMRWVRDSKALHAREGSEFRFELLKPDGGRPEDVALYMGMVGHAAFVKTDGSVFAHVHPNGTASMAALELAQGDAVMATMDHGAMHVDGAIPNTVAFPYGLPTVGRYRVFVQMKHGQTIETGVFDAMAQ